jgi:hypothetical protein
MFKNSLFLITIFCAGCLWVPVNVAAETDFHTFWKKFKTAVVNHDKTTVANLTQFPLSMPLGVNRVKTKAEFVKDYDRIVNIEANAKRCFQATKPEPEGKGFAVYCTFKTLPESSNNRPIKYYFEKTKTGWKFTGLDNINE